MHLNEQQSRALVAATAGAAAVLLAQKWRRRESYDFASKSVLITGGSRGLGLVMARQLAEAGARLTLIARDQDALARASDEIRSHQSSAHVHTVAADVRRQEEADRAMGAALERYGRIDVVINNAGIIQTGPIDHMTLADYDDAMRTHFWGPLYMVLAALPHMRRQGEGRIVNISSIGGRVSVPHLLPYCASKFALTGLSDGLRAELARDNVTVTTVCPGLMRTGSPVNALFKGQHPQEYAWFAISSSLPLATIDARRAAHQILDACRHGDAELIITVQAKLAILARNVLPEFFAHAMALVNRLLPGPSTDGNEARRGHQSESAWAAPSSVLTAPVYKAARENNERPKM